MTPVGLAASEYPAMNAPAIATIDIRKYRVPFPEPIECALGRVAHSATLFVRIYLAILHPTTLEIPPCSPSTTFCRRGRQWVTA